MTDRDRILDNLCGASELAATREPCVREVPISEGEWVMSPHLISLYGTEVWDELNEAQRKRLSRCEAVNFFSININGEKALIEGIARRLYQQRTEHLTPYLHHFLGEENEHMVQFGRFCRVAAGKVYANRKIVLPREFAPGEEDFLFFTKVMIFEEIVDTYNVQMGKDKTLNEYCRSLNEMHHRDEVRHLAFGRTVVVDLYETFSPSWSKETLQSIRKYISTYLDSVWREFYNPDVYADAGLGRSATLAATAWNDKAQIRHRKECIQRVERYLLENGILTEEYAQC